MLISAVTINPGDAITIQDVKIPCVGFVEKDVNVILSYVIVVIVSIPRINVIIAKVIFALK
jgi:hypothetical protein